jgi:nicotinate-nucleotide adenylyltransferase
MNSQTGIFGGTFDPPHLGHLILAAEALQQLGLHRLLWLLTPNPPHKPDQPITALAHRLKMLQLAIADEPHFEICAIELERPGPHYTVETLRLLKQANATEDLVFLMGGDSLQNLPNWNEPAQILRLCHSLGVMRRPNDAVNLPALERGLPGISAKVRLIQVPLLEISSQQIRQRVQASATYRYYLHPQVYEYIERNQLYR